MSDCKAENFWSATVSACWLRATLMSTMLTEWMSGGRRMEGNSIYKGVSVSIPASKVWNMSFLLVYQDALRDG